MTDDVLDGDLSEGTTRNTKSGLSDGKGDKQLSNDATKLQTTLDALTSKINEMDARYKNLQGEKDQGISRTKKEVDDLKRKFAEIEKLKKSGLDDDTAFEELSFRDDVRSLREQISKLSPAQAQTPGKEESKAVDVAKVIGDYQLDGNDPEVINQILTKNFTSQLEAENTALKLVYRRLNPTPPDMSAVPVISERTPAGQKDVTALTEDYKKDMRAARGKPSELRAIKEKYSLKGVKVHEVSFS